MWSPEEADENIQNLTDRLHVVGGSEDHNKNFTFFLIHLKRQTSGQLWTLNVCLCLDGKQTKVSGCSGDSLYLKKNICFSF